MIQFKRDDLATLHGSPFSMVLTTRASTGVGLVTTPLAIRFIANGVGALQMVVPIHNEDVESVSVTDRAFCDLGGDFYSVLVLDRCWCCNHTFTLYNLAALSMRFLYSRTIFFKPLAPSSGWAGIECRHSKS